MMMRKEKFHLSNSKFIHGWLSRGLKMSNKFSLISNTFITTIKLKIDRLRDIEVNFHL